jgi:alkylation response protein AidB-like acyl-CoA dehydrogenase
MLEARLRKLLADGGMDLPFPGEGQTAVRHRKLIDIGREDLALARLAEAHTDAVAILAEAGRQPRPGALYGVWASEIPQQQVRLSYEGECASVAGTKMFCTGAGLIDRALVTARAPEHYLVDVDLRAHPETLTFDESGWKVSAFIGTQTAATTFLHTPVAPSDVIGNPDWYLRRPGFWHGACGPAACWAGGAIGLVEYARAQHRDDAHTLAHLGAMHAAAWALRSFFESAGNEIDGDPCDRSAAQARALTVRHLVEQACSDVLRRLGRAYGPRALAYDAEVSRRYQELDLYIRQSHAERDLEVLGRHFTRTEEVNNG